MHCTALHSMPGQAEHWLSLVSSGLDHMKLWTIVKNSVCTTTYATIWLVKKRPLIGTASTIVQQSHHENKGVESKDHSPWLPLQWAFDEKQEPTKFIKNIKTTRNHATHRWLLSKVKLDIEIENGPRFTIECEAQKLYFSTSAILCNGGDHRLSCLESSSDGNHHLMKIIVASWSVTFSMTFSAGRVCMTVSPCTTISSDSEDVYLLRFFHELSFYFRLHGAPLTKEKTDRNWLKSLSQTTAEIGTLHGGKLDYKYAPPQYFSQQDPSWTHMA